ncbi:MAG: hypothetical protein QF473_29030 [Planctomycetota bacterium]|nr:hypothetical protein [Planctomycetota bacterium]
MAVVSDGAAPLMKADTKPWTHTNRFLRTRHDLDGSVGHWRIRETA